MTIAQSTVVPKRCVNNDDGKMSHIYIGSDYRPDVIRSKKIHHSKWGFTFAQQSADAKYEKYDWCLCERRPSNHWQSKCDKNYTMNEESIGFEFQAAYTTWMWCKIQQQKPQTNGQIKIVALMCVSHLCSRVCQFVRCCCNGGVSRMSNNNNKKVLNDLLLATKCKKFNFPTAHNAAGPLKRNVDEFSRFCGLHLLHSRSGAKWNFHENGWARRIWTTENPSSESLWVFRTKQKKTVEICQVIFIWLCEMVCAEWGGPLIFEKAEVFKITLLNDDVYEIADMRTDA